MWLLEECLHYYVHKVPKITAKKESLKAATRSYQHTYTCIYSQYRNVNGIVKLVLPPRHTYWQIMFHCIPQWYYISEYIFQWHWDIESHFHLKGTYTYVHTRYIYTILYAHIYPIEIHVYVCMHYPDTKRLSSHRQCNRDWGRYITPTSCHVSHIDPAIHSSTLP